MLSTGYRTYSTRLFAARPLQSSNSAMQQPLISISSPLSRMRSLKIPAIIAGFCICTCITVLLLRNDSAHPSSLLSSPSSKLFGYWGYSPYPQYPSYFYAQGVTPLPRSTAVGPFQPSSGFFASAPPSTSLCLFPFVSLADDANAVR